MVVSADTCLTGHFTQFVSSDCIRVRHGVVAGAIWRFSDKLLADGAHFTRLEHGVLPSEVLQTEALRADDSLEMMKMIITLGYHDEVSCYVTWRLSMMSSFSLSVSSLSLPCQGLAV